MSNQGRSELTAVEHVALQFMLADWQGLEKAIDKAVGSGGQPAGARVFVGFAQSCFRMARQFLEIGNAD